MKRLLVAAILAAGLAGVAGCCCPGEIPVSLEGPCNLLRFGGPDWCHYPYSSPPCPYWDGCRWRSPYPSPPAGCVPQVPTAAGPETVNGVPQS